MTTHCPVVGDLKSVLTEFADGVPKLDHSTWIKEIEELDRQNPLTYKKDDDIVRPQYVIDELRRLTKGDAIITTGVGQHQMWAMQWYWCNKPRHFLTSGGLGTMGYGYPAALGAKFGNPDKLVVCIDGDASFQMTACELTTATMEKCPVLILIINNYFLGMVRQWQELFYDKRFASTSMTSKGGRATKEEKFSPKDLAYIPDFVKLAEAHGALGLRVTKKEEVTSTIERALKEVKNRTVLLDVYINPEEKVFPMVPAGKSLDEIIVDMA